jgi:transposase InsO family protein
LPSNENTSGVLRLVRPPAAESEGGERSRLLRLVTAIGPDVGIVAVLAVAVSVTLARTGDALEMALSWRRPGPALIFHSDRGSQYTSRRFRELLAAHGVRQSLSRPGQCWDNAVIEAFYSTLKTELVQRHVWPTRAQARRAIFDYVEVFYNRQRRPVLMDGVEEGACALP